MLKPDGENPRPSSTSVLLSSPGDIPTCVFLDFSCFPHHPPEKKALTKTCHPWLHCHCTFLVHTFFLCLIFHFLISFQFLHLILKYFIFASPGCDPHPVFRAVGGHFQGSGSLSTPNSKAALLYII